MNRGFRDVARAFLEAGVLTAADVYAVALTAPRFGEDDPQRMLSLAFAVRAPRVGHVGVDLGAIAALVEADGESDGEASTVLQPLPWPDADGWLEATLASPMVGSPEQSDRPFVRQVLGSRTLLLTRRLYREQQLVAQAVRERAALLVPEGARIRDLDATIAALFPNSPDGEAARAVRLAATRRLSIVVGGPGTGKTFSITRLLAALLSADRGERPRVVKLAAPTGKAAVRMREAIREATDASAGDPPLLVDDGVRGALRDLEASTLHRLLGVRPDGTSRYGKKAPLPADVIVVDEVSMVDLVLMRRLLEATHEQARLVLLGDRDQLASVEAGCVLADIAGGGEDSGPLAANVQTFTHSRRFANAPDIALIAACLQSYRTAMGDVPAGDEAKIERALDVFGGRAHASNETSADDRVERLGDPTFDDKGRARPSEEQLARLAQPYLRGYVSLLEEKLLPSGNLSKDALDPRFQRGVLDALDSYRVLAVHRRGPLGVAGLDEAIGKLVRRRLASDRERERGYYHFIGRPILVTENAYDVDLVNGDMGVVLPTAGGLAAVFPRERPDQVRAVALSRLPAHEGAFAMTVHKAQGSQFDHVALVLAGRRSPIQTRELIYTGVTRAKTRLAWLGSEGELRDALRSRVDRASGLEALLR